VATPLTKPITSNPAWNDAYARHAALGRWAEPEEMAGPVVFLASDASSYLTATDHFRGRGMDGDGRTVRADAGVTREVAMVLRRNPHPEETGDASPGRATD